MKRHEAGNTAPPEFEEKPIPLWQRLTALALLAVVVVAVAVWHARLRPDLLPVDASRVAPNLLAAVVQWAIVLTAAALIWPPTRRRIHGFVTKHTAPLHAHLILAEKQREMMHAEHLSAHAETQRRLDHVIKHSSDIPPLPPRRSKP
jgi:hypothetical protein